MTSRDCQDLANIIFHELKIIFSSEESKGAQEVAKKNIKDIIDIVTGRRKMVPLENIAGYVARDNC